jgi:hypothetical protein
MLLKLHYKISKTPQNLSKQEFFPNCKNFQKTAKPIGKDWQTNTATFNNFA